jgi:DNA-binding NarL/FixJ family response regulator
MSTLPGPYSVVIADDHALVRDGLRTIFKDIENTQIVGEASDGLETLTLARSLKPNLITLDAAMPYASGMEVYSEIRRWVPETRIAVITGFTAAGHLADWMAMGVNGMFLKTDTPEEMKLGIHQVLNGVDYASKTILNILEQRLQSYDDKNTLTTRERQVLHLLAEGVKNQEIAKRLSISPKTVDNHRTRIMAKLNVNSFGQLIAYALKEGLLDNVKQH